MSSKDMILEKVKKALQGSQTRTAYPEYDASECVSQRHVAGGSAEEVFRRNFAAVHGMVVGSLDELKKVLAGHELKVGCCDPELLPLVKSLNIEWRAQFERSKYDEYQIGVTRGGGAVAETGSLMLRDKQTFDRLAALAPWVHVAVIKRADIYLTLPDALAKLADDPNVILVTGPSKTADVEGILIEGVHGPGVQIAWIVD